MTSVAQRASDGGVGCPVCGSSATHRFDLGVYPVFDCGTCDHRFVAGDFPGSHVEATYGDDYFFAGGDGYENYLLDGDILHAQGRRYGQLLSAYGGAGRLLDIGSAAGFLQAGYEDANWQTVGLEPNATMVGHARSTLGLRSLQGSLEHPPNLEPFDAVCLIQVVGHFHDIGKALRSLRTLTRPGGLCLVEFWRRDAPVARAFGSRWHEYSPPSVLHWFTRESLDRAMRIYGFSQVAAGAPRKYISGRHARSLLGHKLRQVPLGDVLAKATRALPANRRFRYPAFDLDWRLYRRDDGDARRDTTTGASA